MLPKNISRPTIVLFFFLALSFSFLDISKVFFVPHCMAYDVNDDANHTFVNLQQWRRVLSQGQWPMMNVYNNFGTPLIGDVITYPLSPLSLTYAFLPGPMAMTINRAVIGALTLFLLFIFYYRRFPQALSIGSALCTFYAPGFLWHSAHHHFQLSLLVLTAFFILQENFTKAMSARTYIGICALSIVMFLSISLNVVVILCGLILGYQVFLSDGVKKKSLWLVMSGLFCGLVAVLPDTMLFLQATSRSIRGLAEYPVVNFTGPNKIFWTPVVIAGIYIYVLFKEKRKGQAGLILWLGVIPFIIVLLSRVLPFLWKDIPLLGATDVMRLTWGANIFLMFGCGGLILRWLQLIPGWPQQISISILALAVDILYLPLNADWINAGKLISAAFWGMLCVGITCWCMEKSLKDDLRIARRMAAFIGSAVVVIYLYNGFFAVLGFEYPQICHVRGLAAFSSDGTEKYLMPKALLVIPKNSRVAYNVNSISGLDLRGANEGLFGSGARSTIMTNADFGVGLFNKGLIQFDNYTGDYHFCPPWKARELQELGVSYVVQGVNDKPEIDKDWKEIEQEKGVILYQNPLATGVIFLKNGKGIQPVPFKVVGNGLDVQLPSDRHGPQQLVISLLRIPGWLAWIDGQPSTFLEDDNKFLVLPINANDRFVRVRYAPYPPGVIFLSFLIALALPWVIIKRFIYGQ